MIIIVHAHDVIVLKEDMSSVSKQCIIITITVTGYKNDYAIVVSLLTFASGEELGGARREEEQQRHFEDEKYAT